MISTRAFKTLAVTTCIAALVITTAKTDVAFAQDKKALIESLSREKTRSFTSKLSQGQKKFKTLVDTLRTVKTRQITVEQRTEVATFVEENDLPAVDMEIYFDYDSARLNEKSLPTLQELGEALSDAKLNGETFMIAGHTDAVGSDQYNQSLSEKRADSVRQYLIDKFNLDISKLIAIGYGEEQLKLPEQPKDGQNRRVQVVNMEVD